MPRHACDGVEVLRRASTKPRTPHSKTSGCAARIGILLLALGAGLSGIGRGQTIREFPVGSGPTGIAAGPDGALWFTEIFDKIGRITTAGVVTEFSVRTSVSSPAFITAGPDGALWFTEVDGNKIGRITTAGVVTEFPVPTSGSRPEFITVGPDHNLWFTEFNGNKIARITTAGIFTEFPLPTAGSGPIGIAAGPDGALWFTENGNRIGRITTAGVVTEFSVPTSESSPGFITAGPDGALWFTEVNGNKIGRITTAGIVTEFPVPTVGSAPIGIAAGPDGALWFTEFNKIGRITTAGIVTEFPLPTPASRPDSITVGPDGALWFTEVNGNKIGRINPVFSVTIPVVAHVTGVGGSLFLTDLDIQNPNGFSVVVALTYSPDGGGQPLVATLTLAPFETRSIVDAAQVLFGVTNSKGGLRLMTTAPSGQAGPVIVVNSRTYDQATGFGLSISGDADVPAQTSPNYVNGIEFSADFRTNLGAFNITDKAESFVIVLRGPDGSVVGTSAARSLGPLEQFQGGLQDLFPGVFSSTSDGGRTLGSRAGPSKGLSAEFHPMSGSTVPVSYGGVADNQSHDLTYYGGLQPGLLWYLPIFSHVVGRGGALFTSQLSLQNTTDTSSLVTLTFLERDRDNTTGAKLTSVRLAAHETATFDDGLLQLFGLSATLGAIKIDSEQLLVPGLRIFTQSPTSGGTVGNQINPSSPQKIYKKTSILGLKENAGFRCVVGFFNPNAAPVTINLVLQKPTQVGSSPVQIGNTTVSVNPRGMSYAYLTSLFPGVDLPPDQSMTMLLDASDKIVSFGNIVDNATQKLTYLEAKPTGPPAPFSTSDSGLLWGALASLLVGGLWKVIAAIG